MLLLQGCGLPFERRPAWMKWRRSANEITPDIANALFGAAEQSRVVPLRLRACSLPE